MSVIDSQRIWNLKEDAKWARNTEAQKMAVQELGKLGTVALPSLQEIMAITVHEAIRQCCNDEIKRINNSKGTENVRNPEEKIANKIEKELSHKS